MLNNYILYISKDLNSSIISNIYIFPSLFLSNLINSKAIA